MKKSTNTIPNVSSHKPIVPIKRFSSSRIIFKRIKKFSKPRLEQSGAKSWRQAQLGKLILSYSLKMHVKQHII